MVDAIILAGAANLNSLREYSEAPYEALIKVGNKPMLHYVINALEECRDIGKIAVVGPKADIEKTLDQDVLAKLDSILESEDSLVNNIEKGMRYFSQSKKVLIVSSDIPLIKAKAISDFLDLCRTNSADIYYPIVSKEINEKHYPGVQRTYVKLKNGTFTGGNIFLINPQVFMQNLDIVRKAINLRKKPFKLSMLLGLRFILKFVFGMLEISGLEKRVSEILNCKAMAVISSYPEIGIDVDKPGDLELVQRIISS